MATQKREIINVMVGGTKAGLVKAVKSKYGGRDLLVKYTRRPNKVGKGSFYTAEIYGRV